MTTSEAISAAALFVSIAALFHTIRKARREDARANRAEARVAVLESKQQEEEQRRKRTEAPYFVPIKLSGGTKDEQGFDLWRLKVQNEGRACLSIEIREADYRFSQRHIRSGEAVEIVYRMQMFPEGHKVSISVRFETSDGYVGEHAYQLGIGQVYLRRVEPKPA